MSEERTMGMIGTTVAALVALVLSAGALITASGLAARSAPAADVPQAADAPETVEAELSEFHVDLAQTSMAVGGTISVTNAGSIEHDLEVVGVDLGTPMLAAGESADLDLGALAAGTYTVRCTVPGHESAGMTAELVVGDPETGGNSVATAAHGGADTDWAALDAAMTESMRAFPAETAGRGNQLLEPEEVLDDGTKVFRLVAEIIDWEVEPGKVVEGWAYNGQIPGPRIHVDVGDRVRVHVENHLPLGTDVHWHGVRVPNDQDGVAPLTQPLIEPGDTYTYEFTADEPSIGMYHPHHHGQMKLPNGMFGAFQIGNVGEDIPLPLGRTIGGREIPEELTVAAELPMILNDAGTIGLSINGKGWPATDPIVADQDDWIVIHYYNEGLQIHPMHLHQMPQLVFAKDGFPLESPVWQDTVNVAPGERYSVLIHASDPGVWAFHCHILSHAEREDGMFGMVTALIVDEA
ncbi:MAG: multicopper oxidase domain-containing protein [Nitriliruptoraceae bacterium]